MSKFKYPQKSKYKRSPNRIYFLGDFQDGEEIEFAYKCEKPSADAIGNVWYKSCKNGYMNLINIKELEEV
jgi:hypothetical protein